jgi:hypothetical protein
MEMGLLMSAFQVAVWPSARPSWMGVLSEPFPIVPVRSEPFTAKFKISFLSPNGVSIVQFQLPSTGIQQLLFICLASIGHRCEIAVSDIHF